MDFLDSLEFLEIPRIYLKFLKIADFSPSYSWVHFGAETGGGAPRRPQKSGGAPRRSKMGGGAPRRPKMGGGAPRRPVKKQSTQNPPMLLFSPKSCTSAQTLDTSLPEPQLTQCLC